MARVYVSLGSNIERERHIRAGITALRAHYGALLLSPVYESVAVGFTGDAFYNLVAAFDTREDPWAVALSLREIEDRHARDRAAPRFSARSLDLDLLLYDTQVLDERGLRLPRPDITEHAFVLGPLADIAGLQTHPVLGVCYADLWRDFDQKSQPMWRVELDLSTGTM